MMHALETGYDVDWDVVLDCWCLHYQGEIICLGSEDYDAAMQEAELVIEQWQ